MRKLEPKKVLTPQERQQAVLEAVQRAGEQFNCAIYAQAQIEKLDWRIRLANWLIRGRMKNVIVVEARPAPPK